MEIKQNNDREKALQFLTSQAQEMGLYDVEQLAEEHITKHHLNHSYNTSKFSFIEGYNKAKESNNDVREDDVEKLATEWIDKNSHKWSNNTDEVGDNYGSFVAGWTKCKENTYTEEQVREVLEMSKDIKYVTYSDNEIIQSLKQPK